ncbi:MAG: VCBS repeat-containing protein [Myxococcales bacterium]|nr:VCBS repeat-containing protein [Myxococcales bacterium]
MDPKLVPNAAAPSADIPPVTPAALPKGDDAVSAQAIALPGGAATVGGMGESFSAQLTTGIATFSVPFALPSPRGNVGVSLGLVYSSSGGYGLAGVGWSLAGQVAIARQTDRGVPKYQDLADWHPEQDRFVFGAQELVPICKVTGTECTGGLTGEVMPAWANGWQYFRARVEGSFLRFFWSPNHRTWRVQSKDGSNLELGVPLDGTDYAGGVEANPKRPEEIYRWHLVRQYDARGDVNALPKPKPVNVVVYRYSNDGAIAYLSDVFHTPPATDPETTEVGKFAHHARVFYEARPDTATSYRAGFAQEQRLRVARVDVTSKPFAGGIASPRQLVRRYHLAYEAGAHASLLQAVQMEGRCAAAVEEGSDGTLAATTCPRLPKQSFEYEHVQGPNPALQDSQGLSFERLHETVQKIPNSPPHSLDDSNTSLMDVNADSLPDVVVTAPIMFSGNHGLFLNGASGTVSFSSALNMTVTGVPAVDANVLKLSNSNVSGLDLDGDARVDLVHMPIAKQYSVFTPKLTGNQWTWAGRAVTTASGLNPKIDFTTNADRIAVMDVNSDGLVDVVFSSALEVQTFFALGRYPGGDGRFGKATLTSAGAATFSDDPATACTPWSATPVYLGDNDVRVADMNGDGLPDMVRVRSGQLFYWPGRGNGFWGTGERDDCPGGTFGQARHVEMQTPPNFQVLQAGTLELADVNGDGFSDLLEVRFDAVDVYLNVNGTGWTPRQILSKVPIKPTSSNWVRLADIDGSGTPDIVWGEGYGYNYVDLTGGVRPQILVRAHNGLGKTTELEYSTSTKLMLAAAAGGTAWDTVMPLTVPVVVRSRVKDNLDKIGRPLGVYTTEYAYRNPVFDGRQREFRGFSIAETRSPGDANSPTATTRSTFLLGECRVAQNGLDVCKPEERWRDNWREPLKGLPVLVETFDEAGVYLSTDHTKYELRQLYSGRDGRRVSVALAVGQESFAYDTANFVAATLSVTLDEVSVNLVDVTETEQRSVVPRGTGAVKVRSRREIDSFGNPTKAIAEGCVEGCPAADEIITTHTAFDRPTGDTSGWLFRPISSHVTGSVQTAPRKQMFYEYDSRGDLSKTKARLSGTLPLQRFHAGGLAVAPAPTDASGGESAPVDIVLMEFTRDPSGNVTGARAAVNRCRTVAFDPTFAQFPISETVLAGDRGTDGCGTRAFATTAEYDAGLGLATRVVGVTGQPTLLVYDGFGRITSRWFSDPSSPGQLAPLPTVTYAYSLPSDASTTPYSTMVVRSQDGANSASVEYIEQHSFVDGLGRPLAVLSEADSAAGDGGDWVVGGVVQFDAKGAPRRAFESFFYTGAAASFSLGTTPTTDFTSQRYDAFGRVVEAFGLDGQAKVRSYFHALSRDVWDAEDLAAGAHQGTYATVAADGHGRPVRTTERIRVSGVVEERSVLREYLPAGEVSRIIHRRVGSPDVVRWMRYDSLGRMLLNAEPNTSVGFSPSPATDPATIKAWRYAYNDAGDLVGTSDARGCGVNYHFEAAGRMVAEDYSPCEAGHAAYSAITNLATGAGAEVLYRYDLPDPEGPGIVDAGGHPFPINTALLLGRIVSVADRASKGVVRYDSRGRVTGTAVRIAKPGGAAPNNLTSYAPRWYIQERTFDAADRTVQLSTGATVSQNLGDGGLSTSTASYSRRGRLVSVGSSYGALVSSRTFAGDGLPTSFVLGDQASTQRAFAYDQQRRVRSVQTFRAMPGLWTSPSYTPATSATQQLLLEDYDLSYDEVGNVVEIKDWRAPSDWPAGAKPVSRSFEYDDLYRLTRAKYEYAGGSDAWTSPFAAENSDPSRKPQPSPHVAFSQRVKEQRYSYDHLGNTTRTTDDSSGFFDRSLGDVENGTTSAGPHQLRSASNRTLASASARKGDLSADYDAAGNLKNLINRRDGPCEPAGASCWQRFGYSWDELGHLVEARRWDLVAGTERTNHGSLTSLPPARAPDALLRYLYDGAGQRVIKTAEDTAGAQSHTVYLLSTLELRSSWWTVAAPGTVADYALTPATESVILPAADARARIVYSQEDLPSQSSGHQHVFIELSDYLGSTGFVIDRATGELVEHQTYMAYGGADSDYRPGRWGQFREPYKFSGKEEDIEVGLQYFGARYLVVGLGRWASADAATIHYFRADPNPYAYVAGRPMVAVDPNGNEPVTLAVIITAVAVGALVGAGVAMSTSAAVQYSTKRRVDWGWKGVLGAGIAGAAGGAASGGMGALGAGVWAGGVGGGVGAATSVGLEGGSAGQVAIAGLVGFGTGLGSAALGDALDGLIMQGLEQSATMELGTAVHVSAALSGAAGGAASGIAGEGMRDFLQAGHRTDYGRAAAVGAGAGAAGYAGAALSGGLPNAGTAFATNEDAIRQAAAQNQAKSNAGPWNEFGAFSYEWGGRYYTTESGTSGSNIGVYAEDVQAQVWAPPGSRLTGFAHSHPPEAAQPRDGYAFTMGKVYNFPKGMHTGDVNAAKASYMKLNGGRNQWIEAVSSPQGTLEYWSPGMQRPSIQPSLRVPRWR